MLLSRITGLERFTFKSERLNLFFRCSKLFTRSAKFCIDRVDLRECKLYALIALYFQLLKPAYLRFGHRYAAAQPFRFADPRFASSLSQMTSLVGSPLFPHVQLVGDELRELPHLLRLARRYLAETDTPSALRAMDNYSCKDIFTLTQDPGAGAIRERYFDFLGRFLAQVCCVVDPEAVVLGGGVSKAGQALLDGVQAAYRRYAFHASRDTKFALATLGADAGIYGGMKLVLDEFGGTKR